ncbi:hypothetical protein BS329_41625 [Amycolatopsis coloradensis]|uniref:Uncharacterized protein n=1 Tax=Amycolatopsis coloradensis TaxID=76021 RepID=A0A1R0KCZ2_9PSEU|nr:hypothetical protein [Amycolatopsis coloradensis]OLZ42778.1 hypothetical protein BS329_41625 [Amycolatopsis coloradensis]
MEKLRLQYDRDVDLAWRTERDAAYTRLFTVMLALEPKFHAPIENPDVVHDEVEQQDFQRIHLELHDVYTLVMIGSSTAVDAAGRQLIGACKDLGVWYSPKLRPTNGAEPNYTRLVGAFNAAFEALIDACRHELKRPAVLTGDLLLMVQASRRPHQWPAGPCGVCRLGVRQQSIQQAISPDTRVLKCLFD